MARGPVRRLFRLPFARRRVEREIEAEIRFHLESRIEELVAGGVALDEARRQASREYGDVAESRRELAAVGRRRAAAERAARWRDELGQDLRLAARTLARQPGFAAVVVLVLALGIGANAAVFTVVDAALLRPLPYAEPERLVHVVQTKPGDVSERSRVSYVELLDLRAPGDFAALEGFDTGNFVVASAEGSQIRRGARVTPGFLDMLGVRPALGRSFTAEEGETGARVVVVGHGFWERELGGARDAVGRVARINREPYEIVGVLPRDFHFAPFKEADILVPVDVGAARAAPRSARTLAVVGRLRDGVRLDQARAGLATVMRRLADEYPETTRGRGVVAVPLRDVLVGGVRPILVVVAGAGALVLLVACVNVASLFLTRAIGRGHELAVRAALGASRWRLARLLVVEVLVLAAAGGVLAAALGTLGVRALVRPIPPSILSTMPYLATAGVDARALAVTGGLTLVAALLFGTWPALRASRAAVSDALRRGGRGTVGGGRARAWRALVVAQLALTLVLLAGTGLLARSLVRLLGADTGFDPAQVVVASVSLQGSEYASSAAQVRFFERLVSRLAEDPGVRAVGAVTDAPLGGSRSGAYRVDGQPEPDPAARPEALMRGVAGDYFRAMGIRLRAGRDFTPRDDSAARGVVIVSEALARARFGAASPLGQRLRFFATPETTWEIVGVVGDVKTGSLDAPPPPTIYYPQLQRPDNGMVVVARGADAAALADAIRREVRALDADVPVHGVAPMARTVAESRAVFTRRYPLLLVGTFAATALVLAVVGLYGTISHSVARRTPELAVRLALGAREADILSLVLREGARVAALGLALGLAASLALASSLRALLYGIGAADPATYAVVALGLGALALAASWLPARRAASVDPLESLRAGE